MIEPEPLQQVDRTCVRFRNRKLIYFSGCDYFRQASNPTVLAAARAGLEEFGLNVAASRFTSGNHPLFPKLERALAGFFRSEAALLLPAGYLANSAVAQGLTGRFSHALMDERAHPALVDAARLLKCPVLPFKHRDPDDLGRVLRRRHPDRPLVLTDGLFGHDGSIAPLKAYLKLLPAQGMILVDDAHGAGVLGRHGRGTPEAANASRRRIIQCISLSKAFGVFGGAVLCTRALRTAIRDRSRMMIGSTPLPLPLANAALASVNDLKSHSNRRQKLFQNVSFVRNELANAGVNIPDTPGPIISLAIRTRREAGAVKNRLLEAGIFPPFVNYPGGPGGGHFRFAISSEHRREQLIALIAALIPRPGKSRAR